MAALSAPPLPRARVPPTEAFAALAGDRFMYVLYFQELGPPDQELAHNPRETLRALWWSLSGSCPQETFDRTMAAIGGRLLPRRDVGLLSALAMPSGLPDWLTEADLDYVASAFSSTGFTGALNWYRNFDRNWRLTERLAGATWTMPMLFIGGSREVDGVTGPAVAAMEAAIPDVRTVVVEGAGHWVQQERPAAVNHALLEFLAACR